MVLRTVSRLWGWRGERQPPATAIYARMRLDRRGERFTRRLQPGDIAVIDQVDLDRDTAQELVEHKVAAVLNVASSISGRYPNLGPQVLLDAGVLLVDEVDASVFGRVVDGERLHLAGGELYRKGRLVARGAPRDAEWLAAATSEARAGMAVQLEVLAASTRECLRRDSALLLDGVGVPNLDLAVAGRHVLVAMRGQHLNGDLALLRPYIREYRPVLLAVNEAADALLAAGHRPDLVVADLTTLSERALDCAAELIAHAAPDGRVPGLDRAQRAGRDPHTVRAASGSASVALVVAEQAGAQVIVSAGMHRSLPELLDGPRSVTAETFLAQLRVGGRLVDARAARRLCRSRVSAPALLTLVAAAVLVIVVAGYITPLGQMSLTPEGTYWQAVRSWITEVLP